MTLEAKIKRIIKTGKVELGTEKTLKNIINKKVKAVVIAENIPLDKKELIEKYAKLNEIPVVTFKGSSLELGTVCGKPFLVASLSIIDNGDVKLKELTEEQE